KERSGGGVRGGGGGGSASGASHHVQDRLLQLVQRIGGEGRIWRGRARVGGRPRAAVRQQRVERMRVGSVRQQLVELRQRRRPGHAVPVGVQRIQPEGRGAEPHDRRGGGSKDDARRLQLGLRRVLHRDGAERGAIVFGD